MFRCLFFVFKLN